MCFAPASGAEMPQGKKESQYYQTFSPPTNLSKKAKTNDTDTKANDMRAHKQQSLYLAQ